MLNSNKYLVESWKKSKTTQQYYNNSLSCWHNIPKNPFYTTLQGLGLFYPLPSLRSLFYGGEIRNAVIQRPLQMNPKWIKRNYRRAEKRTSNLAFCPIVRLQLSMESITRVRLRTSDRNRAAIDLTRGCFGCKPVAFNQSRDYEIRDCLTERGRGSSEISNSIVIHTSRILSQYSFKSLRTLSLWIGFSEESSVYLFYLPTEIV